MKKPTHIAHVVTEAKSPEGKAIWHRVGAVWPHKDGIGFDIAITDGIAVSGRLVCTVPKEKPELAE